MQNLARQDTAWARSFRPNNAGVVDELPPDLLTACVDCDEHELSFGQLRVPVAWHAARRSTTLKNQKAVHRESRTQAVDLFGRTCIGLPANRHEFYRGIAAGLRRYGLAEARKRTSIGLTLDSQA